MKKIIFISLISILFGLFTAFSLSSKASAEQPNQVKFNNQVYTLKYSTNKTPSGEYMNEYYKEGESGFNWTELITVCEFPQNNTQPLEFAETIQNRDASPDGFEQLINRSRQFNSVTFIFLLKGHHENNRYLEFNVMKVEPFKGNKGLKTVQYAKKYQYSTREELTQALNSIEELKRSVFEEMKNTLVPPVVHKNLGE